MSHSWALVCYPLLDELKAQLVEDIKSACPAARFPVDWQEGQLPGFVSICFPGHPAEGLLHLLDLKGIAVSAGAACDTKNTQVSHVLQAIHLPSKYANCTLRITLGVENTQQDVEFIMSALSVLLRYT